MGEEERCLTAAEWHDKIADIAGTWQYDNINGLLWGLAELERATADVNHRIWKMYWDGFKLTHPVIHFKDGDAYLANFVRGDWRNGKMDRGTDGV